MKELRHKTEEVDITLTYYTIPGMNPRPQIVISGMGDLPHHLIEGLLDIVVELAIKENCCHRKEEYLKRILESLK